MDYLSWIIPKSILILIVRNVADINDVASLILVSKYIRDVTLSDLDTTINIRENLHVHPRFLSLFTKLRVSHIYVTNILNESLMNRSDNVLFSSLDVMKDFLSSTVCFKNKIGLKCDNIHLSYNKNGQLELHDLPKIGHEDYQYLIYWHIFDHLVRIFKQDVHIIDTIIIDITLCDNKYNLTDRIEHLTGRSKYLKTIIIPHFYSDDFIEDNHASSQIDDGLESDMTEQQKRENIFDDYRIELVNYIWDTHTYYIWDTHTYYIWDLLFMKENGGIINNIFHILDMESLGECFPNSLRKHYLKLYVKENERKDMEKFDNERLFDGTIVSIYYDESVFMEKCRSNYTSNIRVVYILLIPI